MDEQVHKEQETEEEFKFHLLNADIVGPIAPEEVWYELPHQVKLEERASREHHDLVQREVHKAEEQWHLIKSVPKNKQGRWTRWESVK